MNVTVGLDYDVAELRLRISQNGVGFRPGEGKNVGGTLGLPAARHNLGHIGGSLAIWSQRACATLIEAPTRVVQFSTRIVLIPTGRLGDGVYIQKSPPKGRGSKSGLAVEMIDQLEPRFNNLQIRLNRKP